MVIGMDDEAVSTGSDTTWPELSADLTLARTQARSIMLDTQRATSDGRLLELSAQIELMRTRMAALEQHLFDSQQNVTDGLQEQIHQIHQHLESTAQQLDDFSIQVSKAEASAATALTSSISGLDGRLNKVGHASSENDRALKELSNRLEQTTAQIAALDQLVETERSTAEQVSASRESRFDEYATRLAAIETSLAQAGERIEEVNTATEQRLATQIDTIQSQIRQHGESQDETAASIQFLQQRAHALEQTQESSAASTLDELRHTQQRLNSSMADIALLRDSAVTAEDFTELQKRLEIQTVEQERVSAQVDALDRALQERLHEHGQVLDTHANIMDVTSRLLSEQNANSAEHARSIAETATAAENTASKLTAAIDAAEELAVRVNQNRAIIDATTESTTALTSKVDQFASTFTEQNARMTEVDEQSQTILGLADRISEKITELSGRADQADEKAEAVNDWVAHVDGRIEKLHRDAQASRHGIRAIDARLGEVDHRLDRIDEVAQAQIEAVNDWVAVVDSRILDIDRHNALSDEQFEAINDWSTNLNQRTDVLNDRTTALGERADELSDQATELVARTDELADKTKYLGTTTEQLDAKTAQLAGRTDEIADKTDAAYRQIGELRQDIASANNDMLAASVAAAPTVPASEVAELTERANTLDDKVDTQADRIDAVNDWVTVIDGRTLDIEEQDATREQQIEAINDWSTDLNQRTNALEETAAAVDTRTTELEEHTSGLLEKTAGLDERTEVLKDKSEQNQRQIDELRSDLANANSDLQAVNATPTVAITELDNVNEQVHTQDQRLLGLDRRIDAHDDQFGTHTERLEAINDWGSVVDSQIVEIRSQANTAQQQIEAVNDWVTDVDGRIETLQRDSQGGRQSIRAIDARLGEVDHRLDRIDDQAQEQIEAVNDWSTHLDTRSVEMANRISTIENILSDITDHLGVLHERSETNLGVDQHVLTLQQNLGVAENRLANWESVGDPHTLATRLEAVERSAHDLSQSLQTTTEQQGKTYSESNDELRDFLIYRLDSAEDRIDRRLAGIEGTKSGGEQFDELEREIEAAKAQAQDALAFSENLRLIQTDLVQAVRAEIAQQGDRIERNEELIGQHPGAGALEDQALTAVRFDLHRALERISELESRLD